MNTTTTDTLTLRAQGLIQEWKEDGYNYNEDLTPKPKETHEETPSSHQPSLPNFENFGLFVSILIITALIVGIIIFIYRRMDSKSLVTSIDIPEEDTIYGVDLEGALATVEAQKDYYQCIRLKYLLLLRLLNEEKLIRWHIAKTPTQYTFEWKEKAFNDITNIFMKIRYGNYPATATLYEEECAIYDTLVRTAKDNAFKSPAEGKNAAGNAEKGGAES